MSAAAEYTADVLAMYSVFTIADPYCDAEDDDADRARSAARTAVIAATRYHAFLQTAQQATKVRLNLRLWNTEPQPFAEPPEPGPWEDWRTVTIECPEAQLVVDNVAAGPISFNPGGVERITLPGGPGMFAVSVAARGRDDINRLIVEALSVEPDAEGMRQLQALGGHEQYLIDVWRMGPLTDDEEETEG
jgi:hypothetical protein